MKTYYCNFQYIGDSLFYLDFKKTMKENSKDYQCSIKLALDNAKKKN